MIPQAFTVFLNDDENYYMTPFRVEPKCIPDQPPYWELRFNNLIVFTSAERLAELRDTIDAAFAAQAFTDHILSPSTAEDIVRAEEAAEQAVEDRDALETGADRCPPRE